MRLNTRPSSETSRFLCLKYQITTPCERAATLTWEEIFLSGACVRGIRPERKSERLVTSVVFGSIQVRVSVSVRSGCSCTQRASGSR